jgi:hypothetical protein
VNSLDSIAIVIRSIAEVKWNFSEEGTRFDGDWLNDAAISWTSSRSLFWNDDENQKVQKKSRISPFPIQNLN